MKAEDKEKAIKFLKENKKVKRIDLMKILLKEFSMIFIFKIK